MISLNLFKKKFDPYQWNVYRKTATVFARQIMTTSDLKAIQTLEGESQPEIGDYHVIANTAEAEHWPIPQENFEGTYALTGNMTTIDGVGWLEYEKIAPVEAKKLRAGDVDTVNIRRLREPVEPEEGDYLARNKDRPDSMWLVRGRVFESTHLLVR